jgi:hypothetical protein
VSALLRDDTGALIVRVVNRTPADASIVVRHDDAPVSGHVVDLTGADLARFTGRVALRPWELLTLRLTGV